MAVTKLSVSFDADVARLVRDAAAEEGQSVSAWLAAAAQDRIRNKLLRVALDGLFAEVGAMDAEEAAMLVADARRKAVTSSPADHRAA